MTEYHSAFRDKIAGFLDFNASYGFKRKSYLSDFLKFDRWCLENHPGRSALSRELVHEWIDDSAASRSDASRRAVVMRRCMITCSFIFSNSAESALIPFSPTANRWNPCWVM